MQSKKKFRLAWIASLLVVAALACNFASQLGQVGDYQKTAVSLATDADTIQKTAMVAVTDIGAQITEIGAQITESGLVETVQAVTTGVPELSGEKPADIPVMENAMILNQAPTLVAYTISADFQAVVDFYTQQMVANGWAKVDKESYSSGDVQTLTYTKDTRKATVVIAKVPIANQVSVTISISTQ